MTVADAKALVESWLPELIEALGLGHWTISVAYRSPEDSSCQASCARQVSYNIAEIEFDAESYQDEASLFADLRHELLHVVLSPFDVYTNYVAGFSVNNPTIAAQDEFLRRYVTEQAILNLEKILFCFEKGRGDLFMPRAAGTAGRADTGGLPDRV
jgi:hypothetical protein